jgi:hypothetical protein
VQFFGVLPKYSTYCFLVIIPLKCYFSPSSVSPVMGLFATILALRGRVTGRNLSRSCEDSERTLARQFRPAFAWPEFPQRMRVAAIAPRSELSSVPDASFLPKSGKQPCGLGPFFNACAHRAERGLEIATLAVVAGSRRCAFTLAVARTPTGKADTTRNKREEETRIDFSTPHLHDQRQRFPRAIRYPCVEGDFAKQSVWASTEFTLEGQKVVEWYVARVQLALLFRDSKPFTGRTDCQSRAEPVLPFHFTAARSSGPRRGARPVEAASRSRDSRTLLSGDGGCSISRPSTEDI